LFKCFSPDLKLLKLELEKSVIFEHAQAVMRPCCTHATVKRLRDPVNGGI